MAEQDWIVYHLDKLRPAMLLDIGCSDGTYTRTLAPYCQRIVGIEADGASIGRAVKQPNIDYLVMDAHRIEFPDCSFNVVLARYSLHHMRSWTTVLAEMARVASQCLIVEDAISSARNPAKELTRDCRKVFLELQREVGFSHFEYIQPERLTVTLEQLGLAVEARIIPDDSRMSFDHYFEKSLRFVDMSHRPEYWRERIADLKQRVAGRELEDDDIVTILARKAGSI